MFKKIIIFGVLAAIALFSLPPALAATPVSNPVPRPPPPDVRLTGRVQTSMWCRRGGIQTKCQIRAIIV